METQADSKLLQVWTSASHECGGALSIPKLETQRVAEFAR